MTRNNQANMLKTNRDNLSRPYFGYINRDNYVLVF